MNVTILPDDRCPSCGYTLDACSMAPGNDREAPSPGDISLCFGCGEVLYFDLSMHHQLFPRVRLDGLEPELLHIIRVGQEAIRSRRPRRSARA